MFFCDREVAEYIDLERWMPSILGKDDIRMCRCIWRAGASLRSGSWTPSGGVSGSSSKAFWIRSISDSSGALVSGLVSEASSFFL